MEQDGVSTGGGDLWSIPTTSCPSGCPGALWEKVLEVLGTVCVCVCVCFHFCLTALLGFSHRTKPFEKVTSLHSHWAVSRERCRSLPQRLREEPWMPEVQLPGGVLASPESTLADFLGL